ncbi:MAG: hypothetical protein LBQ40_00710 [Clostridiales bacterium]|jgi:hypothetical protein|nr:hypothetical protein [Clostridiales bacterium]
MIEYSKILLQKSKGMTHLSGVYSVLLLFCIIINGGRSIKTISGLSTLPIMGAMISFVALLATIDFLLLRIDKKIFLLSMLNLFLLAIELVLLLIYLNFASGVLYVIATVFIAGAGILSYFVNKRTTKSVTENRRLVKLYSRLLTLKLSALYTQKEFNESAILKIKRNQRITNVMFFISVLILFLFKGGVGFPYGIVVYGIMSILGIAIFALFCQAVIEIYGKLQKQIYRGIICISGFVVTIIGQMLLTRESVRALTFFVICAGFFFVYNFYRRFFYYKYIKEKK